MTATILDGRAIGAEIKSELRADIEKYVHERGRPPGLVIVRVGVMQLRVYTVKRF